MRNTILTVAILLIAGSAVADDYGTYRDSRNLSVSTADVDEFVVNVGAGSLEIRGIDDATEITVTGRIWLQDHPNDLEKVKAVVDRHVEIDLVTRGDSARLTTSTSDPGFGYSLPHVDLVVTMPSRLALDIRDRSGFIVVENVNADLKLRDDSGSINVSDVDGEVEIDDKSGSITVTNISKSLNIEDSSGSIDVESVGADLAIDDGSGSIRVRDVRGNVTISDGSGSINVARIGQDLLVLESGSGSLSYGDVEGNVSVDD